MPDDLRYLLRARLEASPLPRTDRVWIDLDTELINLFVYGDDALFEFLEARHDRETALHLH